MTLTRLPGARYLWTLLATGCAGITAMSLVLTHWLDLHPCHLCIFQRLLFMILAALTLVAAWLGPRLAGRLAGLLSLPVAVLGIGVAVYQSWLQAQPAGSVSCAAGQPGLIEQLVEWLGQQMPELFLATGFCEDVELTILGLSLANLALLAFAGILLVAALALWWVPRATARES